MGGLIKAAAGSHREGEKGGHLNLACCCGGWAGHPSRYQVMRPSSANAVTRDENNYQPGLVEVSWLLILILFRWRSTALV